MERMKVEIDSEELKRLKSREEKYLAYMDMLSYRWEDKTYVDALCWKVAELEKENRKLKEELAHYNDSKYNSYNNKNYVDREFRKEYTEEEQELLDLDYGTWFTAKFVNH